MKPTMKIIISRLRSILPKSAWNNDLKSSSSQEEEIELRDLSKPIIEQIENRRNWIRIAKV